jgi:hypothetical protein
MSGLGMGLEENSNSNTINAILIKNNCHEYWGLMITTTYDKGMRMNANVLRMAGSTLCT